MLATSRLEGVGVEIIECDSAQPVTTGRVIQVDMSQLLGEVVLGVTLN